MVEVAVDGEGQLAPLDRGVEGRVRLHNSHDTLHNRSTRGFEPGQEVVDSFACHGHRVGPEGDRSMC